MSNSRQQNFAPVSNHQRASYSPSFTLIELLVVVAIIGVLAGMIVLGLNGAKERAQIAKGIAFSDSLRNSLMPNLISEWKLDENQGTTAYDTWAKYNPNNGTLVNGPVRKSGSECVSGSCLQFDGVDDYVNCGNNPSLNITDAITIEAWVKINDMTKTKMCIVNKESAYELEIRPAAKYIHFGLWQTDGTKKWSYTIQPLAFNTSWMHVVGTYSNNAVNIYLNGSKQIMQSSSMSGLINISASVLQIAKISNSSSYNFNGLIDEVRVYNAALPTVEIQQHYVQGLQSLLVNKAISYQEYTRRMSELPKNLAAK